MEYLFDRPCMYIGSDRIKFIKCIYISHIPPEYHVISLLQFPKYYMYLSKIFLTILNLKLCCLGC
jgi:hypothetical protein